MKALITLALLASALASQAFADSCDYVEAKQNYAASSAPLLASYLNFTPEGSSPGANIDRDDDQFGVCRILADGSVITSYGCAGQDHVDEAKIINKQVLGKLYALLRAEASVTGPEYPAFEEQLNHRNRGELMTASTLNKAQTQRDVLANTELASLIREICPLDNSPERSKIVK